MQPFVGINIEYSSSPCEERCSELLPYKCNFSNKITETRLGLQYRRGQRDLGTSSVDKAAQ